MVECLVVLLGDMWAEKLDDDTVVELVVESASSKVDQLEYFLL